MQASPLPDAYVFAYAIDGQLHPPLPLSAHASTITIGRITFLMYADDIVLLADSMEGLTTLMQRLETVSTDWAMTLNYEKTQALVFHPDTPPHLHPTPPAASTTAAAPTQLPPPILLARGSIKFVASFCYLGSVLAADGTLDSELKARMGKTRAALQQLVAAWRHRHVPLHIKMMVYRAIGPPTLLYGAETWPITPQQLHQLKMTVCA